MNFAYCIPLLYNKLNWLFYNKQRNTISIVLSHCAGLLGTARARSRDRTPFTRGCCANNVLWILQSRHDRSKRVIDSSFVLSSLLFCHWHLLAQTTACVKWSQIPYGVFGLQKSVHRFLKAAAGSGKSLLELWGTTFLPDWQPSATLNLCLIYFKITSALHYLST